MMPHAVIQTFLWLLGLCVGSFLNVVVYRLGVGLSIANPVRSFCPHCRAEIAWFDNLPVLSWFLLGGRCRQCRAPISTRYPLIEALTGLAFVLVYHLLFMAGAHGGVGRAALPADLPLLLAWLVLVAGLVVCAAMDITSYTVDVRVTNVVLGAGIVLHAMWPRGAFFVPWAQTATAAGAVTAFVAGAITLWWTVWRPERSEPEQEPRADGESDDECPTESPAARLGGQVGTAAFVGLAAFLVFLAAGPGPGGAGISELTVAATFLAIFAATVLLGGQRRAADREIEAAIEEERPLARQTAWRELKTLGWPIGAGAVACGAVASIAGVAGAWNTVVGWTPITGFAPIGGAVFAIGGAVVGAAGGWLLRIVFTLVYGREAFGVGDIYILAAAGATAGWDLALLGLLLSVGIALAGWLLGLLLKSTVMIPFGPWLAIGLVLALWWHRPALGIAETYGKSLSFAWRERPDLLLVASGLMLIGSVAAVALARLVRRWVAPDSP